MLSLPSIIASLALSHVSFANPISARAACNPDLAGRGINIASGSLELGYASSVAGASIISQALSPGVEFIAEASTIFNGGFVLKDSNQPNQAAGLFVTNGNGAINLQTLVTPEDGTQGWGFICTTCNDPATVGAGGILGGSCQVRSAFSGQCVQIGGTAGAAVTLANCNNSASQSFNVLLG